jgi:hypothetical protein
MCRKIVFSGLFMNEKYADITVFPPLPEESGHSCVHHIGDDYKEHLQLCFLITSGSQFLKFIS